MTRPPCRVRLILLLCTIVALQLHPRALAQDEVAAVGGSPGDDVGTGGGGGGMPAAAAAATVASTLVRRHSSSSSPQSERARAKAIGKGISAASADRNGRGGADGPEQQQQQQQRGSGRSSNPASATASAASSSSSSSAAAARRQERLRTASSGASSTPADYTYIPVDGRVLLRPRSVNKLRDYAADAYGGINEVAQAQPFFGAATVSGRVGLAARYNLDYSDYLSPRNIQARIGPSAHVATGATGRAQGTGGAKVATDSVATRRASYRLDVADGMTYEAGSVRQRLNAASAGATIERDQANDPFYATAPDPGAGLVGKRKRAAARRARRRAALL